jgi:Inner membrane protein CreD
MIYERLEPVLAVAADWSLPQRLKPAVIARLYAPLKALPSRLSFLSQAMPPVFESRKYGLRAFAIFALLYGPIYLSLTSEDQALLIGAVASFVAIAVVMYFTRRIDWYSSAPGQVRHPLTKADGIQESLSP